MVMVWPLVLAIKTTVNLARKKSRVWKHRVNKDTCKEEGNHSKISLFCEKSRTEKKSFTPGFVLLSILESRLGLWLAWNKRMQRKHHCVSSGPCPNKAWLLSLVHFWEPRAPCKESGYPDGETVSKDHMERVPETMLRWREPQPFKHLWQMSRWLPPQLPSE